MKGRPAGPCWFCRYELPQVNDGKGLCADCKKLLAGFSAWLKGER